MKISFEFLTGQSTEILITHEDSVSSIQTQLAAFLDASGSRQIDPATIKIYAGNDRLQSSQLFLAVAGQHQKFHVRIASKAPNNSSHSDARSLLSYSIFNNIEKAFANTALTTTPEYNFKQLLEGKTSLLTTGAIPRDTFVLESQSAAAVKMDNGTLIDLSGMTLNCILGVNDPWVKLRQISYLLTDQPHYVTARMSFPLYYSYPKRLHALVAKSGGEDAVINHRQCNGSDVVELAVHAAYTALPADTTRRKIASFKGSYHGQNLLAAIVSEHQPARFPLDRSAYRELFDAPTYEDEVTKILSKSALETLNILKHRGDEFFAVIIEPIQTRNAMNVCPTEFLAALRKVCTEKNICLIFDEIQSGFGYLGTLCVAESHGMKPDIAVFSKAVTSGHGALSVMVADKKYRVVDSTFSGKTNAGDVLALVAADAVLDRLYGIPKEQIPNWLATDLKDELHKGIITKVPEASQKLVQLLKRLQAKFPQSVGKIKGQGLVRGLEIITDGKSDERFCAWLINRAYENGVYLRQAEHVIIFKPTIDIKDKELEIAFEKLCKSLEEGEAYREQCKAASNTLVVAKGHG